MSNRDVTQSVGIKPTRIAQLQQVKLALARATFTLCWLPSVVLSLIHWAEGKNELPVLLFIFLAIWYLVEYLVPRVYSNFLSISIALLIFYVPSWETNSGVHLWHASTLAGVATVVLAALYAPWPLAFFFLLISGLVEHLVTVNQPNVSYSPSVDSLSSWVAPLWLILFGSFVGFGFLRLEETFLKEDQIAESIETLRARDAISRALSEEHTIQQRLLHETVLNTLASLVRENTRPTGPLLQRLRGEIAEARFYQGLEAPITMSVIVDSVIPARSGSDPQIEITAGEDILLPQTVARDVRDAIAELVRNAIKHSGGSYILIAWEVSGTNLLIKVADNGVGLSQNANKGLGLGQILPEILRDRRAKMSITTNGGTGTKVALSIPLDVQDDQPILTNVPHSLLEEFDSVGRLLLAAPALSVAALGWWLISPSGPKLLLAGLLLLHVAAVLTASINPRARGAWVLIVVGLVVGLVIIFLISTNSKTCSHVNQLRWATNFLCSSTSIGLVFYAPKQLRLVFIAFTTSVLFLMGLFLPGACASALLIPASALLGLFVVILTLWRQSNRWRTSVRLSESRSAELTRRRIERRLGAYRADQWFSALDYLDRFAKAAASGVLIEGTLQRQAHIEEERLRARLQLDPFVNGAFAQLALDLVNVAATRNWTPTITVVETFADSPTIPEGARRALSEAFTGIETGSCHITLYLDENEECLTIVSSSLDLQCAATEIDSGINVVTGSANVKQIRAVFDSINGERWLEIRRRM